jgi:hypothetical protein
MFFERHLYAEGHLLFASPLRRKQCSDRSLHILRHFTQRDLSILSVMFDVSSSSHLGNILEESAILFVLLEEVLSSLDMSLDCVAYA